MTKDLSQIIQVNNKEQTIILYKNLCLFLYKPSIKLAWIFGQRRHIYFNLFYIHQYENFTEYVVWQF